MLRTLSYLPRCFTFYLSFCLGLTVRSAGRAELETHTECTGSFLPFYRKKLQKLNVFGYH